MTYVEGILVRHIPADEADLRQVVGGNRPWHDRVTRPTKSPRRRPGSSDLSAFISERLAPETPPPNSW